MANGSIKAVISDNVMNMTTICAIHDVGYNIRREKIKSYMLVPGQFRLPVRIDMCFCIDSPELLLLIGKGHISIGSPWMENRRIEDIVEPSGKPRIFDNHIPFNEYVTISVILNIKEMQILINGEERFYSAKERYMKPQNLLKEDFIIGVTCTKRAKLSIRSINITEYDDTAPLFHEKDASNEKSPKQEMSQKPSFDTCIEKLPTDIKNEVIKTDSFLKSLKQMKFKRTIEKHGNKISYTASNIGVSYAVYLSGDICHHSLQWYMITNSKPELWHRKSNPMEEILDHISSKSPELAERIFCNLNECIGCREHCLAKTLYTYHSKKKLTCHGNVFFKMCVSDFQDVRNFFSYVDSFYLNISANCQN